ncbi:MAG: CocE/NonD family hydrolase C-terminal non-catalytic domain-containing protein, partial [Planctomycetota bacterium]
FRGRYKNGFTRPEPLPAGEPVEFTFSLHTQDYCWKKGHRLMVQVQSTWFPLIDRNPQTFVTNIFQADDADFRVATHRVYRSAARASGIVLPVVGK